MKKLMNARGKSKQRRIARKDAFGDIPIVEMTKREMNEMLDIIRRYVSLRLPCQRYVMGRLNQVLSGPFPIDRNEK